MERLYIIAGMLWLLSTSVTLFSTFKATTTEDKQIANRWMISMFVFNILIIIILLIMHTVSQKL